jgi:hypothetical protein
MKKKKTALVFGLLFVLVLGIVIIILIFRDNTKNVNDVPNNSLNEQANVSDPTEEQRYFFEYNGVKIGINDPSEPILKELGEPLNYFEAPSCAFEGMDKIYSYSSFEFQTYTGEDQDYVYSIMFLDDTVATREGIGLNATLEDVIAVYGSDYEQSFNQYTFSDGNCKLCFLIENDEVVSIEYVLAE